jgi:hypothetical protein
MSDSGAEIIRELSSRLEKLHGNAIPAIVRYN